MRPPACRLDFDNQLTTDTAGLALPTIDPGILAIIAIGARYA